MIVPRVSVNLELYFQHYILAFRCFGTATTPRESMDQQRVTPLSASTLARSNMANERCDKARAMWILKDINARNPAISHPLVDCFYLPEQRRCTKADFLLTFLLTFAQK